MIPDNQQQPDAYELSPTQLGMLIHGSAHSSGTYIQQMICSLREDLNVTALEKAWFDVVNRHAIFRTSFHISDGPPLQRVHARVNLVIAGEDWRAMPPPEQEVSLARYLTDDQQRGFEPTEAPLIRIALFRKAHAHYEMIWTSHHALMDGRSRRLVLKELFSLYDAYCAGTAPALEQPRPYGDYIRWLRDYDLATAERFWREELSGFSAPTSIDFGESRSVKDDDRIHHDTTETFLSEQLTTALTNFAHTAGVTLNTLVQGSWSLLLSRYTGERDVVFGVTRACRRSSIADAGSMVGLLINTLPVRVRVSSEELLLPWLQNLRASQIAVRQFEHTPLTKIMEWSEIPRGTTLFESIVVYENDQLNDALQSQGANWSNREFRLIEQTNYPLVLKAYGGHRLLLQLEHDETRFDRAAGERILGHLTTLLEGMVNDAGVRIRDLPLLPETEKWQLLNEWQGKQIEFPGNVCIHELFERQVELTPNAPALVFDKQTLTYSELNSRANQLAQHLRKLGVGPEELVAICMERTPLMIIGLLGILKAGGAFVPLDPVYPPERLRFMLEDAAATLIITQRNLQSTIPARKEKIICLDDLESIGHESREPPNAGAFAENLAYVIYTSGSTGKPKGVAIQHRSVAALVNWASGVFSPEELKGVLASTSICFDLSVFELFVTFSLGGCVVLAENALHLQRLESAELVTLINTVPSAISELLRAGAIPKTVKTVNLAGEPLKSGLVNQIYELPHVQRVFDLYGPAEDTTYSSFSLRTPFGPDTIGRPISNTQIHVLDTDFRLVPEGVTGEIYIGGEGLARGYLNRPDLTAERFVPNPFSSTGSERLYRTGDLARYRSDGSLEYFGRVDHQVKIRGYRIELGEIETTIEQSPDVRQSAVIATGDAAGDRKLIAYVVTQNGRVLDPVALRSFLQTQLPPYMLPARIVPIAEMPLTASGKINRRALPKPGALQSGAAFEPPRTPSEEQLAAMWTAILKLERVGIHDNFFHLGGNSLLAFQLISRIRDEFEVELPLTRVFETPTLAELSTWISEAADRGLNRIGSSIKPLPRQRGRRASAAARETAVTNPQDE
jgi:amino acid adenylation domain-containing protein